MIYSVDINWVAVEKSDLHYEITDSSYVQARDEALTKIRDLTEDLFVRLRWVSLNLWCIVSQGVDIGHVTVATTGMEIS